MTLRRFLREVRDGRATASTGGPVSLPGGGTGLASWQERLSITDPAETLAAEAINQGLVPASTAWSDLVAEIQGLLAEFRGES